MLRVLLCGILILGGVLSGLPFASFASLAVLDRPADRSVEVEQKRLQGLWMVSSLEVGEEKALAAKVAKLRLTVSSKKIKIREEEETIEEATFQLDPSKKPATIDLQILAGPDAGKRVQGIYRLEADQWTICVAEPNQKRPESFTARKGSGHTLFRLMRADKSKK